MCLFGIIGYFMRSCDYPLAPVILGVVLGTRMEESFRQTMIMNQGNFYQILDLLNYQCHAYEVFQFFAN